MLKRRNLINISKAAVCFLMISAAVFLFFQIGHAAGPDTGLDYAAQTNLSDQDIRVTIAKIIRIFLGFLGIIAVCIMMYAGWIWMSSEGSPEKIEEAKKILKNAVIGLLIILSAFGIVSFILSKLTSGDGGGGGGGGGNNNSIGGSNSSANQIIENYYPASNQKNVARNTKIAITFREPILASSIIKDGKIDPDSILIYKTVDKEGNGHNIINVTATSTPDNKIFVFKPVDYLGSPSENIWYTVALTKNVKKANGKDAFSGKPLDWSFEVGTYLDFTPPKIESVIPLPTNPFTTEPRNVVVQINFNEAVDPMTVVGHSTSTQTQYVPPMISIEKYISSPPFDISSSAFTTVEGNFYISNMYQTVEFLTEDACGVNSCGDTIYCLPKNSELKALVRASTLMSDVASTTQAKLPYDGIVDMCDNSFDGNSDGKSLGPKSESSRPPFYANEPSPDSQGDDFVWAFNISSEIDLNAPFIRTMSPGIGDKGVGIDTRPEVIFNKFLMSRSIIKDSVSFDADPRASEVFYWLTKDNASTTRETTVNIEHNQFLENSDYVPEFNYRIRDIYQNCYTPAGGPNCTPDNVKDNPHGEFFCCDGSKKGTSCKP